MKIDLKKLETAFPRWSASKFLIFYTFLKYGFLSLIDRKYIWMETKPLFELGTWNMKPRQFYR